MCRATHHSARMRGRSVKPFARLWARDNLTVAIFLTPWKYTPTLERANRTSVNPWLGCMHWTIWCRVEFYMPDHPVWVTGSSSPCRLTRKPFIQTLVHEGLRRGKCALRVGNIKCPVLADSVLLVLLANQFERPSQCKADLTGASLHCHLHIAYH